jgi:hypothetical protein
VQVDAIDDILDTIRDIDCQLSGPIPFVGIGFFYFRGLDWRALLYCVSGVQFFQLFFSKPAGGGELDVYHEEAWMPGKNAVIGTLKNRASLPRSEVIGLWIAVSHRSATPAVTVAEFVDKALGKILEPQRNCAALPIRDANGASQG